MKSNTGIRLFVISAVVLVVAGVVAVTMLIGRSTSSAMSGMSHGSNDASASSPTPTHSGDMEGMDMSGSTPAPTTSAEMPLDMPGMEHGTGDSPGKTDGHGTGDSPGKTDGHGTGESPGVETPGGHEEAAAPEAIRPLLPVMGTFGGGTAVVLLTAGLLRRKDRAASQARQAARAARRSAK